MERLSIGRIVSTRGLRGELRIVPAARDLGRFEHLRRVHVEGAGGPQEGLRVTSARQHKNLILLKLEGVDTIEQAERLIGCDVLVDQDEAIALGEDEYFVHDLVGLEVVTDSGRRAGVLEEVLEGPANDIYVVRGPFGELMVPAIAPIVVSVDLAARTMLIHDLPGLLEPGEPV